MKLSTRSRYGLRAVVELAAYHGNGPTNLQDIADSQQVSRKYLDTMFNSLKVAGLAMSRRGLHGGWVLTRPPEQIQLTDVMQALEGSLGLVPCVDYPDTCARKEGCFTRDLYVEIHEAIVHVLQRYTLADLVQRRSELDGLIDSLPGDDLCAPDRGVLPDNQ